MHLHQVSVCVLKNGVHPNLNCKHNECIANYLPHITFRAGPPPDGVFLLAPGHDGLVTSLPEPLAQLPGQQADHDDGGHTPGAQHCDHSSGGL